jgi:hypothetical protein
MLRQSPAEGEAGAEAEAEVEEEAGVGVEAEVVQQLLEVLIRLLLRIPSDMNSSATSV